MHPYLPIAVIPAVAVIAWFAAPHWSASAATRYHVPTVAQIEDPSALMEARSHAVEKPEIRVQAFLPQEPARPPEPEPSLILQSVVIGDQVRLATINGLNLLEGDRIDGYVVRRIAAEGVDLAGGGGSRHLPMRPLHELPPPARPVDTTSARRQGSRQQSVDLTEDFWRIFDSLKP